MKESKKEKVTFLVSEGPVATASEGSGLNREKVKKPLVFAIMGIIFAACLCLIFGTDSDEKAKEELTTGINAAVPQASDDVLPNDKGKVYEQEMLREKEQQKRDALQSLSDYWHADSTGTKQDNVLATAAVPDKKGSQPTQAVNPALGSYRTIQRSLGNFYRQDNGDEIRRENEKLKEQLEQKARPDNRETDRLQLIEKSYQMAAKYFPGSVASGENLSEKQVKGADEKEDFVAVLPGSKSVVSSLVRSANTPLQRAGINGEIPNSYSSGQTSLTAQTANSIRACIHQSIKLTGEGTVQLRLLEEVQFGTLMLPRGFILSAVAKFQTSRLQLQVISIEIEGSIYPVNLTAYDLDGQKGLNLPYAAEVTAVNSTLANMGNTAGGSFTINRSAGQQITSDAARGLLQGVSGYFSKKVKPQKATLTAGYQLFLVSKKK